MSRHSDRTWKYRVKRAQFLRDNDICWLCGHHGANQVDHVIPRSRDHDGHLDVANWRPAHGPPGCPTCARNCNQKRGNRAPRPYRAMPAAYEVQVW